VEMEQFVVGNDLCEPYLAMVRVLDDRMVDKQPPSQAPAFPSAAAWGYHFAGWQRKDSLIEAMHDSYVTITKAMYNEHGGWSDRSKHKDRSRATPHERS